MFRVYLYIIFQSFINFSLLFFNATCQKQKTLRFISFLFVKACAKEDLLRRPPPAFFDFYHHHHRDHLNVSSRSFALLSTKADSYI